MKKLLALCLAFCGISALHAQEFTLHNNGLIYSEKTMSQLNRMVLFNLYHTIQYYKISQKEGIEEKEQEALVESAVKPVRQSLPVYLQVNK